MLMDEPFGALDPLTRAELQREFADLASRLGKTILFVTHDVREAFLLATRVVLFQDGRIAVVGTPGDLEASDHPEARAFVESARQGAGTGATG
jgi:osmoprotectant transport system ATP-binding protein